MRKKWVPDRLKEHVPSEQSPRNPIVSLDPGAHDKGGPKPKKWVPDWLRKHIQRKLWALKR